MSPEAAAALVAEAADRLWSVQGADALTYLHGRGLLDEAIHLANLGVVIQGRPGSPEGIVIPWYSGEALTLVKVRQPEGRTPKYLEVFRDRDRHAGLYPGRSRILPGRPLIITEGEFDCVLLGQELGEIASVVTLGSASARPTARTLGPMLAASPWYIATDADEAGDKAAGGWPAPARRIRPPKPYKDWTEAQQDRVNLRRWWADLLSGIDSPQLFTWEELSTWRWGPAVDDPTPGIVID